MRKTGFGLMLAVCFLWAASRCSAADVTLVQTNTVAVGESRIITATGSNIVVATEGLIRLVPIGPGKLVMSGVKAGRTDLLVLDDNGLVKEHYLVIITELAAQQAPSTAAPAARRKIKVYEGGKLQEFEVNY